MIQRRRGRREAMRIATRRLTGQALRIVDDLSHNGPSTTSEIAQRCSIGNVSDAALKANRELEPCGYKIVCRLPKPPIRTRFGISQMHIWEIKRVSS